MPNTTTNPSTAAGFAGSVFKYSISTFANMGILGISMVLTLLFIPPNVSGQINIFLQWTNTFMTIAIFGLDQAFFRFYNEPPASLSKNGLFRICFYFSSSLIIVAGIVCSTLFLSPIYSALQFSMIGPIAIPLLFLNAFFYMVARYFNVLFRMEGNIALYTFESILMQLFYKLFYLFGALFGRENPVPAMIFCSVLGMGIFALLLCVFRRKILRLQFANFKSGGYKTVLPYGAAIAPTAIIVVLNGSIATSLITGTLGDTSGGIYSNAYMLSNIVSMVQLGFAAYWGPYMFANYKTQKARIMRMHNYINLIILCFFALLVAFQDIIFIIFPMYAAIGPIFPLMMLSAVFTILCETTVYGNAIARKPIFDTLGFALSFAVNIAGLMVLMPLFGLHGAAVAIVAANGVMALFRTITAQRFYKSIPSPLKTILAVLVAITLAVTGTLFSGLFFAKLLCAGIALVVFALMYLGQLKSLLSLGVSFVKRLTKQ